jgi:hypothetical protein
MPASRSFCIDQRSPGGASSISLAAEPRSGGTSTQRTAVVFHGLTFLLAAILFNAMCDYVRHGHRLLDTSIDSVGPKPSAGASGPPRPGSAPELLGALLPVLGMAVIAAFIPFYWRPIPAEIPARRLRATSAELMPISRLGNLYGPPRWQGERGTGKYVCGEASAAIDPKDLCGGTAAVTERRFGHNRRLARVSARS